MKHLHPNGSTPHWMCEACSFTLNPDASPDECPECGDRPVTPQQQDDSWLEDMGM